MHQNQTAPVVHFPTFIAKAHPLLVNLIWLVSRLNILPSRKYGWVRQYVPANIDPQPEIQSLADIYEAIGKLCNPDGRRPDFSKLGEIPGLNTKFLVEDIALALFRRAIPVCRSIEGLAVDTTVDIAQINQSREFAYFSSDLVNLSAILRSRMAFIHASVLTEYLARLECVQALTGHNHNIEALCNKLRAITKPRNPAPVSGAQVAA